MMSLLHIGLGLLGLGGVGGIATILVGPAKLVELGGQALAAAGKVAAALLKNPAWLVAGAALVLAAIQYEHARHWRKQDAGDVKARHQVEAVLLDVKKEVDRGVGQPTQADQAPFYIRRFVDNVLTLKGALDRQSAALRVAQQQAEARARAAADAAQPTPGQRQREKDRQKIVTGTGALTPQEWGKL